MTAALRCCVMRWMSGSSSGWTADSAITVVTTVIQAQVITDKNRTSTPSVCRTLATSPLTVDTLVLSVLAKRLVSLAGLPVGNSRVCSAYSSHAASVVACNGFAGQRKSSNDIQQVIRVNQQGSQA